MKAIVFQGQSQYDVLRTYSSFYTQQLQQYGIETITCDMTLIDAQEYLKIVDKFKPDFTLAFNPVVYSYDNNKLHFQKTRIPHIVKLGDNPFYHVNNRALANPNDPFVFTLAPQITYKYAFKELNVTRYKLIHNSPASQHYKIDYDGKVFPLVFFGSYVSPDSILQQFREICTSNTISKIVIDFCMMIEAHLKETSLFLSDPIEIYFSNYLIRNCSLNRQQIITLTREVFYYIDHYYRNLTRKLVLSSFASNGIEMYIFGGRDTQQLLDKYTNVKVCNPVSFSEYISITSHSKVSLNITPMFKSNHERIPTSLFNSTLLCSNMMDDLIKNFPDIIQSSIFYDLHNLNDTAAVIKEVINNKSAYNEYIERGYNLAHEHFTFEKDIKIVLQTVKEQF